MKTSDEIKEEIRKQKNELSKIQQMIGVVAKTESDKNIFTIRYNFVLKIIDSLEWVLDE